MIVRYQQLADRIQLEIEELNQLVAIIQRHWLSAKSSADHDAFLNSVAFSLQSFYTGLERIFELVANEFDQAALNEKEWHKALLALMSQPVQDVRPELLQAATAVQLEEYLRFRHVARNIYATHLNPTRLSPLIEKLPGLWLQLQIELSAFITYLNALAKADEE